MKVWFFTRHFWPALRLSFSSFWCFFAIVQLPWRHWWWSWRLGRALLGLRRWRAGPRFPECWDTPSERRRFHFRFRNCSDLRVLSSQRKLCHLKRKRNACSEFSGRFLSDWQACRQPNRKNKFYIQFQCLARKWRKLVVKFVTILCFMKDIYFETKTMLSLKTHTKFTRIQ